MTTNESPTTYTPEQGSVIYRVIGADDELLGEHLTWDAAWDAAEAWQRAHPLTADVTIRDIFGNFWISWDCVANA